jgi:DNA topoisomerase I
MTPQAPERGAVGLLVVVAVMVVLSAGLGVLSAVTDLAVAAARARTAADAAALAGAAALIPGAGGDACPAAAALGGGNGARLTACRAAPAGVEVMVEARPRMTWLPSLPARAVAEVRPRR